jgi:O-antigen/teichoic acid export membrane protein
LSILTQIALTFAARKEIVKTHRRTLKSIGALANGNLAGSLLGAVGGILVARFVGPEVNGQFRLFTIPLMYMTFLHLGTFDGLNRQIPFFIGRDRPDHVEKLASAAGAWNLGMTIVIASGFLLCALWGLLQGNNVDAVGWLSQALTCVGIFYGGYLGATYRTLNNFVVLARIQLIQAIIAFCLVFTVALWGFYGLCLRAALPAILGVWLYHRARPLRISLRFNLSAFKEVVKIGMPLCFWGTLNTTLWMAVEYSLMFRLGGVKWVGIFAIAAIMRESISVLPQSIHQVIMPRVVEIYARDNSAYNATRRSFQAAGILTIFMMAIVLVISFLLNYFVPLFIPQYIDGLPLMKVCVWFSLVQAASLPVSTLYASGSSWLYGRCILCGFITFLLATWLLIPLLDSVLAIIVGSLMGRIIRIITAYYDIWKFTKSCTS